MQMHFCIVHLKEMIKQIINYHIHLFIHKKLSFKLCSRVNSLGNIYLEL